MRNCRAGFGEPTTLPVEQTARRPSASHRTDSAVAGEMPRSRRSPPAAPGRVCELGSRRWTPGLTVIRVARNVAAGLDVDEPGGNLVEPPR